jgi:hypothetical protein
MAAKQKKDLSAFRAAHDRSVIVPNKIRAALAELEKAEGAEAWEYEAEFIRRAKISQADIGAYRDGFSAHVVETIGNKGKRIWFAQVKVARTARETLGAS